MLVENLRKETVELQGLRVVTVPQVHGGLEAELAPDRHYAPRCGTWGHRASSRAPRPARRFRHGPLWGIDGHLVYAPRRVPGEHGGGLHVEALPWGSGKRRCTPALMVTLAPWARLLPWQQVASLFPCAWRTGAAAGEEAGAPGLAPRDLAGGPPCGIDEICRKRGHVYRTNVDALKRPRLLWRAAGRAKDTLDAFFDGVGQERPQPREGVCCDMWQPSVAVIKARAPQAMLGGDKFHIVQPLSKALDQVRRDESREKGTAHKALIAKTRDLWGKHPWHLPDKPQARLSARAPLHLKITRASLLKEACREFWEDPRSAWAKRSLDKWCWGATQARLAPRRKFAWMLSRYQSALMNDCRMPLHHGPVEGLTPKAKIISHKAYGFRPPGNDIRNLYHCMADLP